MAKHEISRSVLEDALNCTDLDLREDYTGRGMYGDTCIGVVGDQSDLETFERELAKAATLAQYTSAELDPECVIDDYISELDAISDARRSDSMGMSTIYYYPQLTVTED